jgi:tetratricopeptide (TPR) repeat protein
VPSLVLSVAGPGTEYTIDPVSLRAVAIDLPAMHQQAAELLRSSQMDQDIRDAASKMSMAAFMLATAGQADSAETLLRDAIRVQAVNSARPALVSRLRLVQVLQELDKPEDALAEAKAAHEIASSDESLADLRDFVLHHLGKALLEAGQHMEGVDYLYEALRLRQAKADEQLILSTQMALDVALRVQQTTS